VGSVKDFYGLDDRADKIVVEGSGGVIVAGRLSLCSLHFVTPVGLTKNESDVRHVGRPVTRSVSLCPEYSQ